MGYTLGEAVSLLPAAVDGDDYRSVSPADAPPSIPGLLMDETAPLELVPTEEFPATAGFDTILPIPAAPAPVLG